MNPPWLTQEEIDDLCYPLAQAAAQVRFLRREYGLTVDTKRNGYPLVMRAHFEEVRNPGAKGKKTTKYEPDRAGLIASFSRG